MIKEIIDTEARKCIAVNTERIKNLQLQDEKLEAIWQQVSNHLQTQINDMIKNNEEAHEKINGKLDKIIWYIAISLLATASISIIVDKII